MMEIMQCLDTFQGVKSLIKSEYLNAHYVHCYSHQLNFILKSASSKYKEIRTIFFSNLTDTTHFFVRFPQRVSVLDEIVKKNITKNSRNPIEF